MKEVEKKGFVDEASGAIDVSKLRSHLQSISEMSLEFLILLDKKGKIVFANSSFCRFIKQDLSAFIGADFSQFFSDDERRMTDILIKSCFSTPFEQESRQVFGNREKGVRLLRWKYTGVPGPKGGIDQVLVTGRDVNSEQVAAHLISEQDRQLRTVMANLPGMVYRCRNDEMMTLEFVSEGSLCLTGYTPAELIESCDKSHGELIHPKDRDRVKAEMQKAIAGRHAYQFTCRFIRHDG